MPNFSNFISIYDKALSKDDCTQIINDFENDKENQIEGRSGNCQIKREVKKSTDINHNFTDKSNTSKLISSCLKNHIEKENLKRQQQEGVQNYGWGRIRTIW